MCIDLSEEPRVADGKAQLVPVEVLLTERERQEFHIATIEEGSSMRRMGRQLITGWLNIRKMVACDLDEEDEV